MDIPGIIWSSVKRRRSYFYRLTDSDCTQYQLEVIAELWWLHGNKEVTTAVG